MFKMIIIKNIETILIIAWQFIGSMDLFQRLVLLQQCGYANESQLNSIGPHDTQWYC